MYYEYKEGNPPGPKQIKAIKDLAIEYQCKWIEDGMTGKTEDLLQESVSKPPIKKWWVDPEGKVYDVDNSLTHADWAKQQIAKIFGKVDTGAITTTTQGAPTLVDLKGNVVIPPGGYAAIYTSTVSAASGFFGSFDWVEIPV